LIRQFDACPNPERPSRSRVLYILVLQDDRLSDTRGVVVAPLVAADDVRGDHHLYPIVQVEGRNLAVVVTELATIPRAVLERSVANLRDERDRIIRALDILFTGF
jgi:toxin CcdB